MKRGVLKDVNELLSAELNLARDDVCADDLTAFVEELRQKNACPTNPAAEIENEIIAPQRQVLDYRGEIRRADGRWVAPADPVPHLGLTHCGKDCFCLRHPPTARSIVVYRAAFSLRAELKRSKQENARASCVRQVLQESGLGDVGRERRGAPVGNA